MPLKGGLTSLPDKLLPGLLLCSYLQATPGRIRSSTHNLPGVESWGAEWTRVSPISPRVPPQDAAWLGGYSQSVNANVCEGEDSFPAETPGVTRRTYLYTFPRAPGDPHA